MTPQPILAQRLGKTVHTSPLRYKVRRLAQAFPSSTAACLEHWLIDVANRRDARIVCRPQPPAGFVPPDEKTFPNEELIVALCQLQCRDEPQILRLAAQLVSRGAFAAGQLKRAAVMERVEPVLCELARLALRVDPNSAPWQAVSRMFPSPAPLSEPLLHWSRLAQPVLCDGRCNAAEWRLVA
jgi:hypothetical protein